jgi:hypothetical protein
MWRVIRGRGRGGVCVLAAIVAVALAAPAQSAADAFPPPKDKLYFGVSDTGVVNSFKKFRDDVKSHPAVLQTFHQWGFHPWRALNRWARVNARGMISVGTSGCYACKGVISPKQIAKGKGDEYPLTLARRFAAENEKVYIRLLPEMNGHWNAYSAYNQSGSFRGSSHSTKWFRKAWRRFAIIVRGGMRKKVNRRLRRQGLPRIRAKTDAHLPKSDIALMWVPQSTGSPNNSGNQPSDYWPGGRWVDWVGVDIYAKFPNFSGMERIYRSYHKPFVVGEWSPWDFDSPSFVHRIFHFAQSHNRVKMLVYYQGFASGDPHRIWHYPRARNALRHELNHGVIEYPPGSKRPKPTEPSDEPGTPPPDGGSVTP